MIIVSMLHNLIEKIMAWCYKLLMNDYFHRKTIVMAFLITEKNRLLQYNTTQNKVPLIAGGDIPKSVINCSCLPTFSLDIVRLTQQSTTRSF